jgi:hypothetical protein
MTMPPQLREGLRRHPKGSRPPRPIVEQLPSIAVYELFVPDSYDPKTYVMPNISLKYPYISAARINYSLVQFALPSLHRGKLGPVQSFPLKHQRTGFGIRHALVCACGKPCFKVYYLSHKLACKRCHGAVNASQVLSKRTRPVLQVSRLESYLNNKQGIYRRTRERLAKKLGEKAMLHQSLYKY